jgi:hypothetical protein
VIGQRATVSGTTELADVVVDPDVVLPYGTAFEGPQAGWADRASDDPHSLLR